MSLYNNKGLIHSVQFSSVAQSCPTLCDPMNCCTLGLPVYHQLLEFTQIHVHQVGDAIQPSHPLSSPSPPAPNPSQHQGLFRRVNSSHEVAKVLEVQLQKFSKLVQKPTPKERWKKKSDHSRLAKGKVKSLSRVRLFATLWTVAHQVPPSMEFSSKNSGVGCHFLLQGIFPTEGSNSGLLLCRETL